MSLKWAINGVLDDIYFMAQGLPRLLFTWKPENQLSILNFFEKNVKKYPNEIAFVFKDQSLIKLSNFVFWIFVPNIFRTLF